MHSGIASIRGKIKKGRHPSNMRKAFLCLAVLFTAALILTEPSAGASKALALDGVLGQETIRVRVQLVSILATVRDRVGTLAPELNREDFVILDEGQPQEIRVFDRQAGTPLAVTL